VRRDHAQAQVTGSPFVAFLFPGKHPMSWQLLGVPQSLYPGQHSRWGGSQTLLPPECTNGYGTNSPDTRDTLCELRDADTRESSSFPLSRLFLPSPKPLSLCLSPAPRSHQAHVMSGIS